MNHAFYLLEIHKCSFYECQIKSIGSTLKSGRWHQRFKYRVVSSHLCSLKMEPALASKRDHLRRQSEKIDTFSDVCGKGLMVSDPANTHTYRPTLPSSIKLQKQEERDMRSVTLKSFLCVCRVEMLRRQKIRASMPSCDGSSVSLIFYER